MRTGLRTLLDRTPDIEVIGEAADGAGAHTGATEHRPDVVLMDIRMPGVDGITATGRIVADPGLAGVRVLVLTTFDTDEHIFDAIAAGAAGFLLKNSAPDELRAAIRTVAAGDSLLSPSVTTRVLARVAEQSRGRGGRPVPQLSALTEREAEVLREIAGGLSNQEIADKLYLSPATVRTYVSRILTKTQSRTRAELVVVAYENGLR